MLLLAAADRGPAREGGQRVGTPLRVVARQAAQQAVVRGGDAREVVHRHRCEARDVDAELLLFGNRGGQPRVEPVDPLDDEDRPLVERQRGVVPRAASGDEVVARDIDAFALHQAAQVVVEQFEVDGFERLVVVVAVLVLRGLLAIDEVVVERDQHGAQSEHAQVDAQPFGRGGLAARRGSRDEHHAGPAREVRLGDGVGYFGEFPLVEGLGQLDHAAGVAREDLRIDVADGRDTHDAHPRLVFAEDAEHLVLMDMAVQSVGRGARREHQIEAVVVGLDVEQPDVTRRGGQRTVEVAGRVGQRVEVAVESRARVEQGDLVGEAFGSVAGAHLAGQGLAPFDGQVAGHDLPHACLQGVGLFAGEFVDAFDLAVDAALSQRVADVERPVGIEVPDGLLENEPGRALVDADAFERGDVHEADRHRGVYPVVQFFDAVIHESGQERVFARGEPLRDLLQRRSHRHFQLAAEVVADDFDRIAHGSRFCFMLCKGRNYL